MIVVYGSRVWAATGPWEVNDSRPSRKHREPLTADNMPKLANLPFARGPPPASVMVFGRRSSIIFSRHRTPGATWPWRTPRSLPVVRRRSRAHIILYYYNTRAFAGHVHTAQRRRPKCSSATGWALYIYICIHSHVSLCGRYLCMCRYTR